MPGHKLGKGIPEVFLKDLIKLDVTEIPGTDNLHFPEGAIFEAQKLAAHAFGAHETYFLVNGSTCGIHALILTICRPGDKLIVGRDCHKSAINGMMLAGVEPVFVKPKYNRRFSITTVISPSDIEDAIVENPDCAGVFITRPNYYGLCSDLDEISKITRKYKKILAVDEAHGAHLIFNDRLPKCSMQLGADICVQSTHKTLPALTQGAYLHVKSDKLDLDRLKFNLSVIQTTSPSYIIMSFLDMARAMMERTGEKLLNDLLDNIESIENCLDNRGLMVLTEKSMENTHIDRSRLVINVRSLGMTGFEAEKLLREKYSIQVEMSDMNNIVCITTISDTGEDFDRLAWALNRLTHEVNNIMPSADKYDSSFLKPRQVMNLKDVFNCSGKKIKLDNAAGKVSRAMITPYPPGIPVVCPGEAISKDVVSYIKDIVNAGGRVTGLGENMEVDVIND